MSGRGTATAGAFAAGLAAAALACVGSFAGGGCASSCALGDGSAGSRLFYSRCRSCHAPVDPASKSADFWTEYLDRYADRAHLTSAERDSVLAFVLRASGSNER